MNNSLEGYIQKLDSSGNFLWARSLGSEYYNFAGSQATKTLVDQNDNIYVFVYYLGNMTVNTVNGDILMTHDGQTDVALFKLNPQGQILWTKHYGGPGTEWVTDVKLDSQGNFFIVGQFSDTTDFDPGPGTHIEIANPPSNPFPNYSNYLLKLDNDGNFLDVINMPARPENIQIDDNDNIYIKGYINGISDVDLGTGVYNLNQSNGYTFVTKQNSNLDLIWAKQLNYTVNQINLSANDILWVAGNFTQTVDLNPSPSITESYTSQGTDFYFQQFNPNDGELLFTKVLSSPENNQIANSSVDEYGNLYLTGFMMPESLDFDPSEAIDTIQGFYRIFFAKYNTQGDFIWATATAILYSNVMAVKDGNIYVSGSFSGEIDTYSGSGVMDLPLIGNSGDNCFLFKIGQGICSNMAIHIDSLSHVTCTHSGYAEIAVNGGTLPYHISWNTIPVTVGDVVTLDGGGFYEVTVSDTLGCQQQRQFLVNGPTHPGNVELDAHLLTTEFRTGFPASITINAANNGCIPSSGVLSLTLDSLNIYQTATPTPSSISGDTLRWDFTSLSFEGSNLMMNIQTTTSLLAAIGDTVNLHLSITENGNQTDILPTNNNKVYHFPIINAYDPNDKSVYPQGVCDEHYTLKNQPLTYTVRFQNTGNTESINVFILDSISPYLNINSVRIKGQSHEPMLTEILPGNKLKFAFDNILLPDSNNNEPLSHGYVIFEIEPAANIPTGTEIENFVGIYFDFNPPVYTNNTSNTMVNTIPLCPDDLGFGSIENISYTLFPNPTSDGLNITFGEKVSSVKIDVLDMTGRNVRSFAGNSLQGIYISLSGLSDNIYFLRIEIEGNTYLTKVIKSE